MEVIFVASKYCPFACFYKVAQILHDNEHPLGVCNRYERIMENSNDYFPGEYPQGYRQKNTSQWLVVYWIY